MGPQRVILVVYGAWVTLVWSTAVLTRVVAPPGSVLMAMAIVLLFVLATPMTGAAGASLVPGWPVVGRSIAGACCGFWIQTAFMAVTAAILRWPSSWQDVARLTDAHGWLVFPGVAAATGMVVGAAMAWPPRSRPMADLPAP